MLHHRLRAARLGIASIIPAVNGKTEWDGITPLSFNTYGAYTLTPRKDFSCTVKMWGAGGACGYYYAEGISSVSKQGSGGGGGYSTAVVAFKTGTDYVLHIGQGGSRTTTVKTGATYLAGGVGKNVGGTEGGGYSGLFRNSVSQANALLMAGGGGGGGDTDWTSTIGAGGGTSGTAGDRSGQYPQGGTEGSSSAGGVAAFYNSPENGSALQGGKGQTVNAHASLGGGGGGYYGGGGGNVGGGGGGSGRVKSDADVSSGSTSAGSGSTPANSADADRSGAGAGGVPGSTSGSDGKILLTLV